MLSETLDVIQAFHPTLIIEADNKLLVRENATVVQIKQLLEPHEYRFRDVEDCWSPTLVATPAELE